MIVFAQVGKSCLGVGEAGDMRLCGFGGLQGTGGLAKAVSLRLGVGEAGGCVCAALAGCKGREASRRQFRSAAVSAGVGGRVWLRVVLH